MRRGLGFHARHSPGGAFSPLSLFTGGVNGAWYDPSDPTTLFSDRAGTTPCGTPGGGSVVPVGAMLDKRAAGYSVFFDGTGDYLTLTGTAIGSGDFTVEGWVYPTAAGSQIYFDCRASDADANGFAFYRSGTSFSIFTNGAATSGGTVSNNVWTHLAFVRSAGTITAYINGTQAFTLATSANFSRTAQVIGAAWNFAGPVTGYMSNVRVVVGTAVYTGAFTPAGPLSPITGTSLLTCGTSWTGNPAITKNGDARVDGLNPFTASPVGNHAIAANDTTARPELRARVNLLTYSEDFGNAYWTKNQLTVTTDAAISPNGTLTADLLTESTAASANFFISSQTALSSGATYTFSLRCKPNGRSRLYMAGSSAAWGTGFITFNLLTGVVSPSGGSGWTGTITNLPDGWYLITATRTASASGGYLLSVFFLDNSGNVTYTGDGVSGMYYWGAQLTATNEFPANTYQRIVDANTYDAVGFPRYLVANGTSSAMSTPGNVNLSGTDKVTVFAGVRKLSDVGIGAVVELGNGPATNTFAVFAPRVAPSYTFRSAGSINIDADSATTFSAPTSNVLSGAGNIAAPSAVLRVNGVQVASNTSSQGTGNYSNNPLFIGARNNASLFLNGNIYSLIVVGSAVSAGQISATEQWVAQRTGIVI